MSNEENRPRRGPVQFIAGLLEIPPEAAPGMPRIELAGNREVLIEQSRGIIEYTPQLVRLRAGRFVIHITGQQLVLRTMRASEIIIGGNIASLSFTA